MRAAKRRPTQSSVRGRRYEKTVEARPQGGGHLVTEVVFELIALGPLMVDRVAVDHQRGHGGRPFVGQDDGVAPVEHGRHNRRCRDDCGDRDVAVEEPELGRVSHLGIDPTPDVTHREAGQRRRVLDGGEALSGRVDHAQRGVGMVPRDGVDGDDGVDATAEGDEWTARHGVVRDGPAGAGVGSDHLEVLEAETVAVRELREPVHVVAAQEGALRHGRRVRTEVDHRRRRRLVIGDTGEEEEQTGGGGQSAGPPRRRRVRSRRTR